MTTRRGAVLFVVISVGIASSFSLLGGLGIESVDKLLLPITPLLIILPAMNSLVGDYATLIAAHAGDKTEAKLGKKKLAQAIVPSLIISTTLITSLGLLLGRHRGFDLDSVFIAKYCVFVILSILGGVSMMFGLTSLLDRLLKNRQLNPDDVLIPIITTVTDIFMLGLIATAARLLF